ncbi:MAG: TetR/AcrR family transcriptional regulator [Solirubrobacterales bacterium]
MADRKSRRRYDSPIRREQAAATRRSILDAAQRLFEAQGYAATSMAAIAAEAGVSLKTVYVVFDTKGGILRALWHLLLRGDADSVPIGDREWFRQMLDEPDPRRQIRLVAENSRIVKARAGALIEVIRGAAVADPDIAELWGRIQSEFHQTQRRIVESLSEKGALDPDLDTERAADVLWALNHPSFYWLLADQRGWTPGEYERWLVEILSSELLA